MDNLLLSLLRGSRKASWSGALGWTNPLGPIAPRCHTHSPPFAPLFSSPGSFSQQWQSSDYLPTLRHHTFSPTNKCKSLFVFFMFYNWSSVPLYWSVEHQVLEEPCSVSSMHCTSWKCLEITLKLSWLHLKREDSLLLQISVVMTSIWLFATWPRRTRSSGQKGVK